MANGLLQIKQQLETAILTPTVELKIRIKSENITRRNLNIQ